MTEQRKLFKSLRPRGLTHVADLLTEVLPPEPPVRPATAKLMRLIEASGDIRAGQDDGQIAYHHTVFCQTALPYRNVPERVWERSNGSVSLRVEAGSVNHPRTRKWVNLPLPCGIKARLILIHFDTLAILGQSPEFEIEHSMTAFLKKLLGYAPNGKELKAFKDQSTALTGALFRIAAAQGNRSFQIDSKIVSSFQLWYPDDDRQNTLWPSYARLSDEYFRTLKDHAVPLDYRAVAVLKESALALDVYKWLAQRLHRIPANNSDFIPWPIVQLQFGQAYGQLRDFRRAFNKALKEVHVAYPAASKGAVSDERGLTLHLSAPPIHKLLR